jgi:membrane associated rhomboid family serine protease
VANHEGDKLAGRAILALAAISALTIIAGVIVATYNGNVGAVFAIASGAVGGIVAIVLRGGNNP